MSDNFRYILDKSSKKYHCPNCGKRRFVRYIDSETGQYLPEQYGRCDRESKCVHSRDPYTDGYAKAIWQQEHGHYKVDWKPTRPPRKTPPTAPAIYPIPYEVLKSTQSGYERNIFIQNLLSQVPFPFEVQDVEKVISLYQLGTVPDSGAICFPYIDKKNRIRAIQEKIFDRQNHTDKSKQYHTTWIHSRLKYTTYRGQQLPQWLINYEKNDGIVSCLFGEHLLTKYPNNPVALVEAPKTAIYGALYFGFPDQPKNLLWLAIGGLSYLNHDRCKVLEGRDVVLFPDSDSYKAWSKEAESIQRRLKNTRFTVSDLLERLAPDQDKEHGNDLADYLIKQDWQEYRKYKQPEPGTDSNPKMTENDCFLDKNKPEQQPKTMTPANPSPGAIEAATNQPEDPEIEVYKLDDLANGIKTPIFTGSQEEYEIFEKNHRKTVTNGFFNR